MLVRRQKNKAEEQTGLQNERVADVFFDRNIDDSKDDKGPRNRLREDQREDYTHEKRDFDRVRALLGPERGKVRIEQSFLRFFGHLRNVVQLDVVQVDIVRQIIVEVNDLVSKN